MNSFMLFLFHFDESKIVSEFGDIIQHMTKFRLQLIDGYPFDISKQTHPMTLNYTCFCDTESAKRLEIVGHGFRYLSIGDNKKIIMLVVDEQLNSNEDEIVVRTPYTIYQQFKGNNKEKVKVSRQPIGLLTPLLPKLQASKEINVYFNLTFKIDQAIIKFLSSCDFICQTGEYYIDCLWLEPILNNFRSIKAKLDWQHAISQRKNGRFVSYLRVFIEVIEKTSEPRLFRKGQTKLTIKQESLHPYNIYKSIRIQPLQVKIYSHQPYRQAAHQISQQINNQIIVLQTEKDIGLQAFLCDYSQNTLDCNFKCIDCENISSTKEFWNQFQSILILQHSLIFIKNIAWVEELYQSEQILNYQVKNIVKKIQKEFEQLNKQSLRKYCVVIQHIGQNSIHQFFQNARTVTLKLEKSQKLTIFTQIFNHFNRQHPSKQQIIHQFHDKLGWQVFHSFMGASWNSLKALPLNDILKKMRELVKQEQVENLIQVSWDDVGGLQTAKEEIIQTVLLPIKHPQIFDEWIKPRTGLLFYGPPGTGKTLLGKCVAKECKMSFISVKGPQLLNMYVGESEKNVRAVFQRARACSPCIVFMDQLDALVPKRGNSGDSNQVMDRIVAELLQQMDTAAASQVFIIGATNRPDLLDPSILRPGRFDKQIYLGITQAKEDRIKIIKAQTRHLALAEDMNWETVLESVPKNFTGADFYGLTSKAVMAAADRTIEEYERGQRHQKIMLREEDFLSAAKGIKSSVTEADLARYQQLKKIYS